MLYYLLLFGLPFPLKKNSSVLPLLLFLAPYLRIWKLHSKTLPLPQSFFPSQPWFLCPTFSDSSVIHLALSLIGIDPGDIERVNHSSWIVPFLRPLRI